MVELKIDASCLKGLSFEAQREVVEVAKRVIDGKVNPDSVEMLVASFQARYGYEAVEALNDLCDQILAMREVA